MTRRGIKAGAPAAGLAALLCLASCGLLPAEAPAVDPCLVEITKLEGKRTAEIAAACQGYTFDTCPAVEAIDEAYAPLIAEQVECKR